MTDRPSPETILAQAGWVRALAKRLVSDAHLAEDLAQETLAAALERPPAEAHKLRPWLHSVLRNSLSQFARSEGRRRLREASAARRAEDPDGEIVEQVVAHRELVDAVLGLDEPYRTAIVLRYLHERPPREIARRLDVPVKTVNSRITRGLARLRERLDHGRDGDRKAWVLALYPFTESSGGGLAATALGVSVVNLKIVTASLSFVLLAAVAVWMLNGNDTAEPEVREPLAAAPAGEPALPAPGGALPAVASEAERVAVAEAAASGVAAAPAAAVAVVHTVRGRVFDSQGSPAPGRAVSFEGGDEQVAAGSGGWFELRTTAARDRIVATSPGWVTVRTGEWDVSSEVEPVVIVAPRVELAGEVVDPTGWALPGASVRVELPRSFEARFAENLESSNRLGWSTLADANGRFAFEAVPGVEGSVLTAVLDGYQALVQPAPVATDIGLVLELGRPEVALEGSVEGRVVDAGGRPAQAARVALGLSTQLTDEDGLFRFDLARAVTTDTLRAVKQGLLPAVLERPYEPAGEDTGWPDFVEVVLGGPALAITGRVLDHEGEPVVGVRLWIADPTPFGVMGKMPGQMEGLAAGAPVPPMALESAANGPAEDGDNFWDYSMRAGPSTAFWSWVKSDGEGRFELSGLAPRRYRIKLMDDDTLLVHEVSFRAGDPNAVIRLPAPDLWPVLSGAVVAQDGTPLEGVRVRLGHRAYGARSRVFGGSVDVSVHQRREEVFTDGAGRFEFEDVPRRGLYLTLSSNSIVPSNYDLDGAGEGTGLEVEVEARCHVEVVLENTPEADALKVYDGDGERLDVLRISGGSVNATTGLRVVDGRTGVFSVSGSARTIVLLTGGEDGTEVGRLPISLRPGDVNQVRD